MTWIEHMQSANGLQATSSVVVAYFFGCFATGYYLVRARTGMDIREIESGSTGTRNAGRVLGKTGSGRHQSHRQHEYVHEHPRPPLDLPCGSAI